MGDCGRLGDGPKKPFTYTSQVAAASFCTTPISALSVSIDVFENWHDLWDVLYCECDQERDTTVEVCRPMRRCESRGFDAPLQVPAHDYSFKHLRNIIQSMCVNTFKKYSHGFVATRLSCAELLLSGIMWTALKNHSHLSMISSRSLSSTTSKSFTTSLGMGCSLWRA
ncbi:uncharacterized protein K489DRAFT_211186 [Dissoconium aciculare CBS 342.82]|uniref:Uncharacterized protein n=1 Tax=Dissoconium aciculare CBS 342.82 TaxID=1314786 RepID=A0A6J3M4Z3_9PEZI|nr:uncharacterized protein K489DRAFT_211186 [Dissoconium aciculare CBS 342.82]KAF1822574.1 hypothetical protein K489DRAFT_211186 [Dissoconium aciculare CBS 342.82]